MTQCGHCGTVFDKFTAGRYRNAARRGRCPACDALLPKRRAAVGGTEFRTGPTARRKPRYCVRCPSRAWNDSRFCRRHHAEEVRSGSIGTVSLKQGGGTKSPVLPHGEQGIPKCGVCRRPISHPVHGNCHGYWIDEGDASDDRDPRGFPLANQYAEELRRTGRAWELGD